MAAAGPGYLSAARITLLYAAFAGIWILSSGYLLSITVDDPDLQARLELFKGLLFVVVSSGLLYLLLTVWIRNAGEATGPAGGPASPATRLLIFFLALLLLVPLLGLLLIGAYGTELPQEALPAPVRKLVFWFSLLVLCIFAAACAAILLFWRQQRYIDGLKLQTQRAKIDTLLQHFYEMPFIGMATLSADTRDWVRFNDSLCEISGYSREELRDRHWVELLHPDDRESEAAAFQCLTEGALQEETLEKRLIRKDGETVYASIHIDCIRNIDDSVRFFFIMVKDNTARKRIEEDLRALNQQLEQRVDERTAMLEAINEQLQLINRELESYSYSVSHDLRAPLRAISGFAEIIRRRHSDKLDSEGRHYLDNIIDASNRMNRLIDDLLVYSRIGRRNVTLQPVNLAKIFDEVIEDLAGRIEATGVRVHPPPAETLPVIHSNPTLLRQIILNLLANAVTYHRPDAPDGPRVEVRCETGSDQITLEFLDNGIGIAREYQEKIFEVFQRLHGDEEYAGTGIGLAIVKKAVTLLGGRVWLESTPGQGSTFFLQIPLQQSVSGP